MIIKGTVVAGRKEGTRIGFPTINITPAGRIAKKQWGVYVSLITVNGSVRPGVTHLGPLKVYALSKVTCETHVLGQIHVVPDAAVSLRLLWKLREVERFDSVKALRKQIKKDVATAKKFFGF